MGLGWHQPKLPGMGDVQWGPLFAALTDVGYRGAVCIEVEDRAYEGSLEDRQRALRQSKRFLEQWTGLEPSRPIPFTSEELETCKDAKFRFGREGESSTPPAS
jgi:hypothetical protein